MGRKRVSPTEAVIMNQNMLYEERLPDRKQPTHSGEDDFKAVFDATMMKITRKRGVESG